MPIIDKSKLPKEITDKYSIANNAFINVAKSDPKDKIEVEIGDSKVIDTFIPQQKIIRWDNECNVSIRLLDAENGVETVETIGDKIKWAKGNLEAYFYDVNNVEHPEGAREFEILLKKKPNTNVMIFSVVDKDVDYFYQPPLTEEYQDGFSEEYRKEIIVTETYVKDLKGNILVYRPENVIGSYIVKMANPKINYEGGKIYRNGQMGSIYRPKIIDSAGVEVWGELHIKNGILSVTIPQNFLDTAVYPIRHAAGLTFGNTSLGTAQYSIAGVIAGYTGSPASDGTVSNITAGLKDGGGTPNFKYALYLVSDGSLISPQSSLGSGTIDGWKTLNVANANVTNGTNYYVVAWGDASINLYGTSGGGGGKFQSVAYGNWPATFSPSSSSNSRSIYATYTASGGGTSFSPSLSPSISPSVSPSISPSASPSVSPSASISPSLSPSLSPSVSPSISSSVSPSSSISPSASPSVSPSESPSVSPSVSSSVSPSESLSPSISPSISSSVSPSASISPSISPSISSSVSPSASLSPSVSPSISPSVSPSASLSPSISPSISQSISPSVSPSASVSPSQSPSVSQSVSPSASISPSVSPSVSLSVSPSVSPSAAFSSAVLKIFDGLNWINVT